MNNYSLKGLEWIKCLKQIHLNGQDENYKNHCHEARKKEQAVNFGKLTGSELQCDHHHTLSATSVLEPAE